MSDLSELRERLHLDLERVLGAAALVELDADAMRLAILDALAAYGSADTEARALSQRGAELDARYVMSEAAERMAERLRELHRVHVSSEPITEPVPLWEFAP